jgi:fibronectin-binding autotransporter adhesin
LLYTLRARHAPPPPGRPDGPPPAGASPALLPRLPQSVSFLGPVTFKGSGAGAAPAGYRASSAVVADGGAALTFAAAAVFQGNAGPAGGLFLNGASANFSGAATFDSNTAAGDGGGAWCGAGATLTFGGAATFSGNTAGGNGGGLFVTGGCNVSFGSAASVFTANKAAT